MVFSSPLFLFLFLPLVLLGTLALGPRLRNGFLLFMSLLFYAWGEPYHYWVMLFSITVNWAFGNFLGLRDGRKASPWLLGLAVAVNIGLLLHYKYFNFLLANANDLAAYFGFAPLLLLEKPVHLPIGISFFTFQGLSYIFDVYRGITVPQRGPFKIAVFKSLFPQLIAGPIVRYEDVAKDLDHRDITLEKWTAGIQRFIQGLGKKVLIANTLGAAADQIMALPPGEMAAGLAWLGTLCYTLQIYYDFSGYSDMAIGLGLILGFTFPENFNHPYISQSIQEFWRRWHITLSTWFRDYLYIPLGGNRRGPARTYVNLLVVFTLCGVWHGASWNFLIWGLYHAVFLCLERMGLGALLESVARPLRHGYALVVVMVGWVFFRIEHLDHAVNYIQAMFWGNAPSQILHVADMYLHQELLLTLLAGLLLATPLPGTLLRRWLTPAAPDGDVAPGRQWALACGLGAIFALSVLYTAVSTYNPFIYFRF